MKHKMMMAVVAVALMAVAGCGNDGRGSGAAIVGTTVGQPEQQTVYLHACRTTTVGQSLYARDDAGNLNHELNRIELAHPDGAVNVEVGVADGRRLGPVVVSLHVEHTDAVWLNWGCDVDRTGNAEWPDDVLPPPVARSGAITVECLDGSPVEWHLDGSASGVDIDVSGATYQVADVAEYAWTLSTPYGHAIVGWGQSDHAGRPVALGGDITLRVDCTATKVVAS